MLKVLRPRKGSVLLETVAAFIILTLFFFGLIEMFGLVRDSILLNRIAREAAREAVITGSDAAGRAKAADLANQYFGRYGGLVQTEFIHYDGYQRHSVTCRATYPHKILNVLQGAMGRGEVNLSARAVFGWYDFSQHYE
ncbi:MAG: TadE/TadG family type IV pilus assembly protein [Moorellaceae bacterium]